MREVFEAAIAAGLVPSSRRDRGALLQAIAGRIDEGCHPADLIAVFRATFDPAGGAVRIPARLWLMKTELVRPRRTAIAPAFVEPIAPAEPDAVGGYAATARANLRAVSR